MIMAISPLMKISEPIRDLFIDVLRKAIYDRYDIRNQIINMQSIKYFSAEIHRPKKWEFTVFVWY